MKFTQLLIGILILAFIISSIAAASMEPCPGDLERSGWAVFGHIFGGLVSALFGLAGIVGIIWAFAYGDDYDRVQAERDLYMTGDPSVDFGGGLAMVGCGIWFGIELLTNVPSCTAN